MLMKVSIRKFARFLAQNSSENLSRRKILLPEGLTQSVRQARKKQYAKQAAPCTTSPSFCLQNLFENTKQLLFKKCKVSMNKLSWSKNHSTICPPHL